MGHAGVAVDGVRPEQEDLRDHRGVAQSGQSRASIRMSIWTASCSSRLLGDKVSVVAAEPLSIPNSISLFSMLILAAATGNRAIPTCATLPAATV